MGVALQKSFAFILSFCYAKKAYRLYKIDVRKYDAFPIEIDGITFRFLSPADENAIKQIEENSEWLAGTLKERLNAGATCVAAFAGNELAGFNLVSFGKALMPLIQLSRQFRQHEAWSEHIATIKNFRKKGLASQLRYRMFVELRKRGIRKFYGGALRDNNPSLQLARRVGFREFVEIRYTRLFSRRRWRYVRLRNEND